MIGNISFGPSILGNAFDQLIRERDKLQAERDQLRAERDANIAVSVALQTQVSQLRARVAELEQALQFYADPDHWFNDTDGDRELPDSSVCADDVGYTARKALGK